MSQRYFFDCIIDRDFEKSSISEILIKGLELGFTYLKPNFDVDLSQILEINEAIDIIYEGTIVDNDLVNFLIVKCNDTYFYLHIKNNKPEIEISFSFLLLPWQRIFEQHNIEDVDVNRYILLLLNLAEKYRIFSLIAKKE